MFNIGKQGDAVRVPQHLHFVGVCGTAMAGVAAELHARGTRVTGSDHAAYPPMSTYLEARGVAVSPRFAPENLDPAPDLVVVGNAISRGNPELEAVLDRGLPYCSLPELVRWALLPGKHSLVVAGTHGKTTTSALCAWGLAHAGRDPSWLVGGLSPDLGQGVRVGDGEVFVLEGDEYDTAFFDKRSKFLHYQARLLVVNNLEFDHADIFEDLEAIRRSFRLLLRTVPRTGRVVANLDDPEVAALVAGAPCPVIGYSLRDPAAPWFGEGAPGRVRARGPDGRVVELTHGLVGSHQAANVLAAAAALDALGVPTAAIAAAVGSFRGVRRRAELRGEVRGVRVYDDFAHHPTAIRSTLQGFRDLFPDRRLWAVVEPRSNTMRRAVFQHALTDSFGAADAVCLRAVPNPEKGAEAGVLDLARLTADLGARGLAATLHPDAGAIVDFLVPRVAPGDVVVVLSNGGFEGIHERLLAALGRPT